MQPGNLEPHYNKGVVLHQAGRVDEAAASFECTIVIAPQFAAAHSALGELRSEAGDHESALRHHERAVALEPGNAELHNNYGLALRLQRIDRLLAAQLRG